MNNKTIEEHKLRVSKTGNVVFGKYNQIRNAEADELDSSEIITQVWKEVDCKSCANCCKSLKIEWNTEDITRISQHLNMSIIEFVDKYLVKSTDVSMGEIWYGKTKPCSFLDLDTNLCTIYDVRPSVCAEWPNIKSKNLMRDYSYYTDSIVSCPATYRWVELMIENSKI